MKKLRFQLIFILLSAVCGCSYSKNVSVTRSSPMVTPQTVESVKAGKDANNVSVPRTYPTPVLTQGEIDWYENEKKALIHLTENNNFPVAYREMARLLQTKRSRAADYYIRIIKLNFKARSNKILRKSLGWAKATQVLEIHCRNFGENWDTNPGFTIYYDLQTRQFSQGFIWG